mmetsp:Transcript_30990/g.46996  ORF Transcript_30990/g.46996 Transcript_30990/m.46996 type:complete len:119 (+) Transcript_30990:207-563(+)
MAVMASLRSDICTVFSSLFIFVKTAVTMTMRSDFIQPTTKKTESSQDPNTSSIMQDDDDKDHGDDASSSSDNIKHPTTMSMQETIAMSLAHSLNNALLLLDDDALSSVRRSQIINTKF